MCIVRAVRFPASSLAFAEKRHIYISSQCPFLVVLIARHAWFTLFKVVPGTVFTDNADL